MESKHQSRPGLQARRRSNGRVSPAGLATTRLRHFSDIVALMPEPAFLLREDGRIAVANDALCQLLHAAAPDLRASKLSQLLCLEESHALELTESIFRPAASGNVRLELPACDDLGQTIALDAGRLAARDVDEAPLAFVRVRTLGDLAQRFQRVAAQLLRDGQGAAPELDQEREALAQEIARLEKEANQDGLTGLDNRRMFDTHLERVFGEAARNGEPLALVLLDIDDFKLLNDTWGHASGDQCLRELGALLAPLARRPLDQMARVGGEEFALVLPGCSRDDAWARATELCSLVAESRRPHPKGQVSVSVGVASLLPSQGDTPGALYRAADEALYSAKRAGKNRVAG